MIGAPSPSIEIPPEAQKAFAEFIAAEYAYFTPRGEPLCWPVTPYWYPGRGVLAVATGLAYPTKADYAKRNPKIAMLFSDPKGSSLPAGIEVFVTGDATVLDEDLQENTDRYIREIRQKFLPARLGINAFTVKLLDFYLPRLWVEMTPRRIEVHALDPHSGSDTDFRRDRNRFLSSTQTHELEKIVRQLGEAVVTTSDADGYPKMARCAAYPEDGSVLLHVASPHEGPACLTLHHHTLAGTRFKAYMARGSVTTEGSIAQFTPRKLIGFFGNGAVFPLSVIPKVAGLRSRLKRELVSRKKPMPELRMPK